MSNEETPTAPNDIDMADFPILCELLEEEGSCWDGDQEATMSQLRQLERAGFILLDGPYAIGTKIVPNPAN